jgi:ring-1,2-phenylacetyl-CoA epoxidase subunit PaaE
MSVHFHPLTVKEVRRETPGCVSISLHVPEELKTVFSYKQGQYLTIKCNVDGNEVRRSYSICSSPFDKELRIAVKKLEGGIFSAYAHHQLQQGDIIEAMPPMGKFFTELHQANKKNYVALAAGSGITPVLSIIKTTLSTEPQSQFTLIYGNRDRHSIIFKEELEGLKNRFITRFRIIHVLSGEKMDAPINSGRINAAKCEMIFSAVIDPYKVDEFFICGPSEMIFSIKTLLEDKGIDRKKIHYELFTTAGMLKATSSAHDVKNHQGLKSTVTIKLDGSAFAFDVDYEGESILNAALKHGADLPFACKGGVCSTCRAKLVHGAVDMDANYALEPEEIESGFILTCQSHPRTEKVVVDFD